MNVGIPTEDLKKLLLACTFNVQFLFNKQIYRQKDGVAMGSPLGPLLADVFMSKLENKILQQTIASFAVYKRYVDDILCVCADDVNLNDTLSVFNNAHPNIRFTYEKEEGEQISFLDVHLSKREDGSLQRSVHRKSTWNGQYIHFESFVPLKQKQSLIRCLTNRATRICTTDTLTSELQTLEEIFIQNGYPPRFVKKNMSSAMNKQENPTAEKKKVYISLPFKGDTITEIVTRRLKTAVDTAYPAAQLCISFRGSTAICTNLKDILPRSTTSFCVYSFACSCGASYIGRTTRRLSERIKEHVPEHLYTRLNKTSASAIALHLNESKHKVNQQKAFRIVHRIRASNSKLIKTRLLNIAEAICIRLRNPDLCAQKRFVRSINLPWPVPSHTVSSHSQS